MEEKDQTILETERILWHTPGRHGTMAKDIKVEMKSYVYFTKVLKMKNDRHEKSE